MKTTLSLVVAVGCLLAGTLHAQAVSTIRLIYGESWSRAGRAVKDMLASDAFKKAAGADYVVELCDESGKQANPKNLGSLKLPVIFVISEAGNCFYVKENVPQATMPEELLAGIRAADTARQAAERGGLETAEACGAFLKKLEKYVGGAKRITQKGFYPKVFEKLKALDKEDKTGWARHFTMGDGLDLVTKATDYRKKKDFTGGEAFLKKIQEELPTNRLTLEQNQGLMMARFALYREDAAKRDEMITLLHTVANAGEETFWGTAAVGWLKIWKVPYQRPAGQKAPVKKPIPGSVVRPRGEVAPAFSLATLKTLTTPLVAKYILNQVGEDCLNQIAQKEGGSLFLANFFGNVAWMESFAGSGEVNIYADRNHGYKWDATARLAGDKRDLAKALTALDFLIWNDEGDFIATPIGRNIATALALNYGGRFADVKLLQMMACYRDWANDGTLHDEAWKHDVYRWRQVLALGQNSGLTIDNLRWIHDFCNLDAPRYFGICWQCAYREWNCFGDSVHGWMYYGPWEHSWNTQELRYRVGGVCGALSKFGSHAAASHGLRSFTAGQPGHCAYMMWDYAGDRWGIDYSVTGHTDPHFSLGGSGFTAAEEQNRYFKNPKRMEAERQRWAGEYEKAMRTAPGNWQAAEEWQLNLRAKKAPEADWEAYGTAVRETFKDAPAQGWQLYWPYVKHLQSQSARVEAVKQGFLTMRENEAKTSETPYFDELALNETRKMFEKTPEALWDILPAILEGQAKTPSFYRQAVNWASGKMMKDAVSSKRFLAIVGESAAKTGMKLDFRDMIVKASNSEDIEMFKQVFSLMEKLEPNLSPKKNPNKAWQTERNGGKLLSQDGMLKLSTTSGHDGPAFYQSALDAQDFQGHNAFHTSSEKAPYAMVILPGLSEVTAITVVNSGDGYNATRQIPIRFWVSENGKDWQEVYACDKVQKEWICDLPAPIKAKYVKIGRDPKADKREFFHLHKIFVYGTKLY